MTKNLKNGAKYMKNIARSQEAKADFNQLKSTKINFSTNFNRLFQVVEWVELRKDMYGENHKT